MKQLHTFLRAPSRTYIYFFMLKDIAPVVPREHARYVSALILCRCALEEEMQARGGAACIFKMLLPHSTHGAQLYTVSNRITLLNYCRSGTKKERENDAENALLRPLLKYLSRLGSHSSCDISISIMSHPAHASIFSMPPLTFLMRQ